MHSVTQIRKKATGDWYFLRLPPMYSSNTLPGFFSNCQDVPSRLRSACVTRCTSSSRKDFQLMRPTEMACPQFGQYFPATVWPQFRQWRMKRINEEDEGCASRLGALFYEKDRSRPVLQIWWIL